MKTLTLPSGLLLMFVEDLHAYRIGTEWETGQPVSGSHDFMQSLGVTEPMNDAMLPWVERGQRVHKATEIYDLSPFFPDLAASPEFTTWRDSTEGQYLDWWIDFLDAHPQFVVTWHGDVEALVGETSELCGVATIADRRYDQDGFKVLELKAGRHVPKVHAVQTAIQGLLAFPDAAEFERWVVALRADEKCPMCKRPGHNLRRYDDPESLYVASINLKGRMEANKYLTTRRKPVRAFSEGSPA